MRLSSRYCRFIMYYPWIYAFGWLVVTSNPTSVDIAQHQFVLGLMNVSCIDRYSIDIPCRVSPDGPNMIINRDTKAIPPLLIGIAPTAVGIALPPNPCEAITKRASVSSGFDPATIRIGAQPCPLIGKGPAAGLVYVPPVVADAQEPPITPVVGCRGVVLVSMRRGRKWPESRHQWSQQYGCANQGQSTPRRRRSPQSVLLLAGPMNPINRPIKWRVRPDEKLSRVVLGGRPSGLHQ